MPRRRQFERERYAIEPSTQRDDAREVVDDRAGPFGPLAEHPYRIGSALFLGRRRLGGETERRDDEHLLRSDAEGLPAGREDADVARLADDARDDLACRVEHVLAVVHDEQDRTRLQRLDESIAVGDLRSGRHPERGEERGRDCGRVGDTAEIDEPALDLGTPRVLDREPCLADAARPGERDQPRARHGGRDACQIVVASHERIRRLRQVRREPGRRHAPLPADRLDVRLRHRDRVGHPRSRDALQHACAPRDEVDAGTADELPHRRGDEDLAGIRQREQARRDRDAETRDIVAACFDLARVHARADADPEFAESLACRERGAQRAGRRLEHGQRAVAGRLDPASLPRLDRGAQHRVVPIEQRAPARVAHAGVHVRGADDVGEKRRGECTTSRPRHRLGPLDHLREEAFDRFEYRIRVDPRDVVDAGDLDQAGGRNVLGEEARVTDADLGIVTAMHDERGHVDAREHVADVDLRVHLDQRAHGTRARGRTGPALPPFGHRGVRVGTHELQVRRDPPLRLGCGRVRLAFLPCRRPRIVVAADPLGVRAVEHECLRAGRVGRREERGHRATFGVSEDDRAFAPDRVHHRAHVVHAGLEIREVGRAVREPRPPLVEADESPGPSDAVEERGRVARPPSRPRGVR